VIVIVILNANEITSVIGCVIRKELEIETMFIDMFVNMINVAFKISEMIRILNHKRNNEFIRSEHQNINPNHNPNPNHTLLT